MTSGEEQNRHRVGERLRDPSISVLSSRALLHGEDADRLAVGYPAEAVGDIDAGPLLPGYDRPDTLPGSLVYKRIGWKAGEEVHALGLQYLRDDVVAQHGFFLQ